MAPAAIPRDACNLFPLQAQVFGTHNILVDYAPGANFAFRSYNILGASQVCAKVNRNSDEREISFVRVYIKEQQCNDARCDDIEDDIT